MASKTLPKPPPKRNKSIKNDANTDHKIICNLNGLLMEFRANIASKRPPTWGRREGTSPPCFRACWVLEALGGLLDVSRGSRRVEGSI
eukprot:12411295-Karenia_brevis.AAC.1